MSSQGAGRKIVAPDYVVPMTLRFTGGTKDCDHDYNDKPDVDGDDCVHWFCTRCGGRVCMEVSQ